MLNYLEQEVSRLLGDYWLDHHFKKVPPINLCNIIASHRGWLPLEIGKKMTVGFCDGTEYTIIRNKNRFTPKDTRHPKD